MLEVRLLGTFEIKHKKKVIGITSRPAQSLFAYLILNAGTAHRREKLAGMLWPDSLEETARDNLRHALWRVRKALDSAASTRFLHADDLGIKFEASSDYSLDAATLEKVSENASADELMSVLSNYGGELLPGFYEEWVVLEREHLYSIFEHQMARLMALLQDERRWLDILDWGERWIKLGQKPEAAYRALMNAHAALGEMSKVAATYERCVKSLKEIGIEPSEQTRAIYENLKTGREKPEATPTTSVKAETKGAPRTNLPVPLTSFIGREKEVGEIVRLLGRHRLVTLTGSGGVGKTRLAIQSSNLLLDKFKDGVLWVDLVGLNDETLVPQTVAQVTEARETPNQPLVETLTEYFRSKQVLLVLDNCEHLISACAQLVEQLLAACLKLKILATSIEALGLFNETVWQVPSLPLPEVQQPLSLNELQEFASIELFRERASHAKSGFTLDDKNASSVAQLCRRLDGIPLAIELAAARMKMLTVDEIAARLDDRFSLLTSGSRTALPRHQTLRATIDWSHDLLTEAERLLLRRLAVFAGLFTLEAAEAICNSGALQRGDILELLGRLVDKSLVIVETDAELGATRYRLLESIRHYALEKLTEAGEAREMRDRHVGFFVKFAEQSEPNIFGGESAVWFKRLDRELDNFRVAIEWATNSGKAVQALQIAGALVYFWFVRGLHASEWHDRIRAALARPEGLERTLARAKALNGIGFMYWADIYPTDRRPELEEALNIGKELGDRWNIATALRNLGLLENIQGNYNEARTLLEQSLSIWREMGSEGKMGTAWTLIFLGDAALNHGDPEWARSLYEESVAILRRPGDLNFLAYSLRRLAQLAWREGAYDKAFALCSESLILNKKLNDVRGLMACLAGFAAIAVRQKHFDRAARLMATVETQLALMGIRLLFLDLMEYEHNLALLRTKLDENKLARFWSKGKAMALDEAIDLALEQG